MDILTYLDGTVHLFPAQRFVLKLMYGLLLSDTDRIEFEHPLVGVRQSLSEKDYLSYLYDQGRSSIPRQDRGYPYQETVLAAGRRAGKTWLCSRVVAYETLNVLSRDTRYGLPENTRLNITLFGCDKDQAGCARDDARALFKRECFTPFHTSETQAYSDFTSATGNCVRVSFRSARQHDVCGTTNFVAIFDEMAFYRDDAIYDAVFPTVRGFSPRSPETGLLTGEPCEAKILCVSTPNGRRGKFYRLYRSPGHALTLRVPTWEMNPTIPRGYYLSQYRRDPISFLADHGAEFVDVSVSNAAALSLV